MCKTLTDTIHDCPTLAADEKMIFLSNVHYETITRYKTIQQENNLYKEKQKHFVRGAISVMKVFETYFCGHLYFDEIGRTTHLMTFSCIKVNIRIKNFKTNVFERHPTYMNTLL